MLKMESVFYQGRRIPGSVFEFRFRILFCVLVTGYNYFELNYLNQDELAIFLTQSLAQFVFKFYSKILANQIFVLIVSWLVCCPLGIKRLNLAELEVLITKNIQLQIIKRDLKKRYVFNDESPETIRKTNKFCFDFISTHAMLVLE